MWKAVPNSLFLSRSGFRGSCFPNNLLCKKQQYVWTVKPRIPYFDFGTSLKGQLFFSSSHKQGFWADGLVTLLIAMIECMIKSPEGRKALFCCTVWPQRLAWCRRHFGFWSYRVNSQETGKTAMPLLLHPGPRPRKWYLHKDGSSQLGGNAITDTHVSLSHSSIHPPTHICSSTYLSNLLPMYLHIRHELFRLFFLQGGPFLGFPLLSLPLHIAMSHAQSLLS